MDTRTLSVSHSDPHLVQELVQDAVVAAQLSGWTIQHVACRHDGEMIHYEIVTTRRVTVLLAA